MNKLVILPPLALSLLAVPAYAVVYKTCWNDTVIPWSVACAAPPKGTPATKAPTPAPAPLPSPAPTPSPTPTQSGPVYKTCWDDTVIRWSVACPTPPKGVPATKAPTPAPVPPQWIATKLGATIYARATKNCSSIYRNAETDRVGIAFNGVVAGKVYKVPDFVGMGVFPASTPEQPYGAGWSHQVAVNIDGQTGYSWTVLDMNDAPGWHATVARECLEGVKPG